MILSRFAAVRLANPKGIPISPDRNPGQASVSRWMTPKYTTKPVPGLKLHEKDHVYPGHERVPEWRKP